MLSQEDALSPVAVLDELSVPFCVHADDITALITAACQNISDAPESDCSVDLNISLSVDAASLKAASLLDHYLEEPTVLDEHIPGWIHMLTQAILQVNTKLIVSQSRLIYSIGKVRGLTAILSFFPCSVSDVVPTLVCLQRALDIDFGEGGWMVRHALILMGAAVLRVPFPIARFEKRFDALEYGVAWSDFFEHLNDSLYTLSQHGGSERSALVRYFAALWLRRDCANLLPAYTQELSIFTPVRYEFILVVIIKMLKVDHTSLPDTVVDTVLKLLLNAKFPLLSSGSVRITLKIWPLIMYRMRHSPKFNANLSHILQIATGHAIQFLSQRDSTLRWTSARCLSKLCDFSTCNTGKTQLADHGVQKIYCGILDRMEYLVADIAQSGVSDPAALHGMSLALAEMIRCAAVDKNTVASLMHGRHCASILQPLMFTEPPRGKLAIATSIRNSACFIAWAAARAYPNLTDVLYESHADAQQKNIQSGPQSADPQGVTAKVANALVCAALFDRDVSCRRAAAAALQEIVGRWGEAAVPHGIRLLEAVSYFSVGMSGGSAARLASSIANEYPLYLPVLLQFVTQYPLQSWDRPVREGAATAFAELVKTHAAHVQSTRNAHSPVACAAIGARFDAAQVYGCLVARSRDSENIAAQHGALMALSRSVCDACLPDALVQECLGVSLLLVDAERGVPQKMLGWDMIAGACMGLVESLCRLVCARAADGLVGTHAPHSVFSPARLSEYAAGWVRSVVLALGSRDDSVHRSAVDALGAMRDLPVERALLSGLYEKTVLPSADRDRSVHMQRGCCLALSAVPVWFLREHEARIAALLCRAVADAGAPIERRTNALASVLSLWPSLTHVGSAEKLRDTYVSASRDYTVDARGDVGSHLREAVLGHVCSGAWRALAGLREEDVLAAVLRQVFDRLDRTRQHALRALASDAVLASALPATDWAGCAAAAGHPERVFPLLEPVLRALQKERPSLFVAALQGLVHSAGSVSPQVCVPARDALRRVLCGADDMAAGICSAATDRRLRNAALPALSTLLPDPLDETPALEALSVVLAAHHGSCAGAGAHELEQFLRRCPTPSARAWVQAHAGATTGTQ